ncbi:hypothetical protein HK103_002896 [Boothiomyces macroporosus]|uniref:Uncharacterized protein n=1 Tax=Boothiomyces macroporosus TaxID=261099 RepID=A0AAD5U9E7_9FUNG|nr:hypothetical protein HK103_002896 [Boothiomyces macroporosus]
MVDPTSSALIGQIYNDINQGWEAVKLLEIIMIPYGYFFLRPNKVASVLLWIAIMNVFHNLFSYLAMYIGDMYPTFNTQNLWTVQAAAAAAIRSLELYCNLLIVSAVAQPQQIRILKIVTVIAVLGVWGGRIYDVYGSFLISSSIRVGMAIVAAFGVFQSTFCLWTIHSAMNRMGDKSAIGKGQVHQLLFKSAIRLAFIQFIDIFEFIGAMWMRGSIYTLWWDMIAGNLDNSRALFMFVDLLMTKIETMKGSQVKGSNGATQNQKSVAVASASQIRD